MATNRCMLEPDNNGQSNTPPKVPTGRNQTFLRAQQAAEDMVAVAARVNQDDFVELVNKKSYVAELANTIRLNPHAAANRANMLGRLMQWFLDPADATNIRNFFKQAQRRGAAGVDTLGLLSGDLAMDMSRLNLNRSIYQIRNGVYDILRNAGIRSKKAMDDIFLSVIEEGSNKYASGANLGVNGRMVMDTMRERTLNRLRQQGLTDADIDNLIKLADGYIAADEVALQTARASGLRIDTVDNIGYFDRVLTPEAKRLIRENRIEFLEGELGRVSNDPQASVTHSRSTFDFVIEDQIRFADAMGVKVPGSNRRLRTMRDHLQNHRQSISAYQHNLENGVNGYNQHGLQLKLEKLDRLQGEYNAALDASLAAVIPLLDDEGRLIQGLANMPIEKLNALADDGVLSKIPMTSHRVWETIVSRYELPFRGLDEYMVTDPVKAHQLYVENLQRGMRDSVMTQNLVRGAVEEGWAVSGARHAVEPEYAEFVNLGQTIRQSAQWERYQNLFVDANQLNDLYVHPDVARSYVAMLDFNTNPASLQALTRSIHNLPIIHDLLSINKRAMLTSAGFLTKNFLGVYINGWQAGANLATAPRDAVNFARMLRGNNLDVFDNTVRRFAGLTERELYLELVNQGVIDSKNLLGESIQIGQDIRNLANSGAVANRMRYVAHQLQRGNVGGALGRLMTNVDEFTGNLLQPLLLVTTLIEDSMKFTTAKTLLADSGLDASMRIPVQVFSGSGLHHYTSVPEAVRHIHRYFIDFNDRTNLDKFISSTVFPFWQYTSRNIPLQTRYMMRHPGRFMAYYRLYAAMNGEAQQRGSDFPEAGMNSWQADGNPIYVEGHDEYSWITLATELFDPIMETHAFWTKEFLANTAEERIERELGQTSVFTDLTNYLTQNTFGLWKSVLATITQEDPFTGQEFRDEDSLLGGLIPVQTIADATGLRAGFVSYLIETNVPYVQRLNRSNPGGVWGVSEMTDSFGRIIREERRSIFGVSRYDRDALITGDERELPLLLRQARTLGLPAYEVDVASNVQQANEFYVRQQREFKTRANDLQDRGFAAQTDEEAEALFAEWLIYEAMADEMAAWAVRTDMWLERRGMPTGSLRREKQQLLQEQRAAESRGL